jgi:hypothetical protein
MSAISCWGSPFFLSAHDISLLLEGALGYLRVEDIETLKSVFYDSVYIVKRLELF